GKDKLMTANSNSSVNELLDAPQVRALSEQYAKSLAGGQEASRERDVIGMAIVVNGQIEEVNVYPNHALFARLYPRLVQSYALQAALLKDQPKPAEPVTVAAVAQFMKSSGEKATQEKALDAHNKVNISEYDGDRFQCATRYQGQVVHLQLLKKNGNVEGKKGE